jgi:SPP1 gp7 family putative phage head morphogenesis protein
MGPKSPTLKTQSEIVRLWKRYSKRLHEDMSKNIDTNNFKVQNATYTDEELKKLTKLIDLSYNEVNAKFYHQVKDTNIIPEVDLSSIKKNKEIYGKFVEMRDEHIHYFKKYPEYVHQKLVEKLQESKESVEFNGPETAEAALSVAKALEKSDDIARRHANFIARDQMGKFNASIHEAQAKASGASQYVWRTSLDQRVRASHKVREGKIFNYDKPPSGGNPGIDFRCRCFAEAVLEI